MFDVATNAPAPEPTWKRLLGRLAANAHQLYSRIPGGDRIVAGVDIGASHTKIVVLRRLHGRITLRQAVVAATPVSATTGGEFTNSILVADHLRSIRESYQIRQKRLAVAAGGAKVFARSETLPKGFDGNYLRVVRAAAEKTLPYPLESATLDYQPVNGPHPGEKRVMWVSVPTQKVEWLREAVSLAGNNPAMVDVDVCALANTFAYNQTGTANGAACVLLHVGERFLTLCLFQHMLLQFSCNVALERHKMAQKLQSLSDRVAVELGALWDDFSGRAEPPGIQRLYLSGGAARERAVAGTLHHNFSIPVEEFDPFRQISYSPSSEAGQIVRDQGPSLSVAVGLALRSFEDL